MDILIYFWGHETLNFLRYTCISKRDKKLVINLSKPENIKFLAKI